jgi:uncharacterized protein (TIGR03083 family)
VAYEWIIDALEETWDLTATALEGRGERDLDALTCCPGWSVRDIVNHLTGTESLARGVPLPEVTGPRPSHVRNVVGEGNEAFVVSRRHLRAPDVVADFRDATRATLRRLRDADLATWERPSWSPMGPRPLHRSMETRVLDSWIHLQDIRDALLEPADDHGRGEDIVVNTFEAALPFVWARRVPAPEGSVLRLNLVGRLGRCVQVAVRDGRGVAVRSTAVVPSVEITTAVALFWRAMAGRINADAWLAASATDVRGDRQLVRRLGEVLNVVP